MRRLLRKVKLVATESIINNYSQGPSDIEPMSESLESSSPNPSSVWYLWGFALFITISSLYLPDLRLHWVVRRELGLGRVLGLHEAVLH